MECDELLYCRRSPLWLKGAVYGSYIGPAILHGSEAWSLKLSEIGILRRTERSMVRAMYGVQLKDRKRSTDLMLSLCESIDQLAIANSVCWYGHVLMIVDGYVLRKALYFDIEDQRKKKSQKRRTWNKQVEEESVKVGLTREDVSWRSKWSVGVSQIAAGLR